MPRLLSVCALTLSLVVAVPGLAGADPAPVSPGAAPLLGSAPDRLAADVPATDVPATHVPTTDVPATDVIVQWRSSTDDTGRQAVRRTAGVLRRGGLPLPTTELVGVPPGQSAEQLARALRADPRVAFAEPDAWLQPSSDDAFFGVQWGLENRGQNVGNRVGTAGVDVRATQAWAAAEGRPGSEVVVAITDSAVDVTHPDLAGQLWRNPGERVNGLDDDGNGFVDDVHGWDFVTDTPVLPGTVAVEEHGTHVAGIVAAERGNGIGVAGTTARALLMPVAFIGPEGGPTSAAVEAIAYASANGAQVINASWGGPSGSQALEQAIARSAVVVVAAVGNEGKDNDAVPDYPASYGLANVISVAAVGNAGELADFSNRGRRSVDLGAPGVDVASTVPGGYGGLSGTSMAAPHVAGAAAMVRSLRPDLSAAQVVALLKSAARPLAALRLTTSTGGMLDAEAAVVAAISGAQPLPACPDGVPSAGFGDVVGNVHLGPIDCGVWYGLIRGSSATTYSPALPLRRDQIATLLAGLVERAGRLPASAPDAFDDDGGNVHAASIDRLASLGILSGVGTRAFGPQRQVTRGQIATLLVATQEYLTGQPLPAGTTGFTDVGGDTHLVGIEKAFGAGLVRGTSPTTFSPAGSTRRDQAASLITRELQVLIHAGAVEPQRP